MATLDFHSIVQGLTEEDLRQVVEEFYPHNTVWQDSALSHLMSFLDNGSLLDRMLEDGS
jgi:hypothetical protein